jgi:hypothetical protein
MAYACLTTIERTTGQKGGKARDAIEKIYRIDRDILDEIGRLVSTKGTPDEARKLDIGATLTPLTDKQKKWIAAAVRLLIRRKAEYDADPTAPLTQLTMADVR